MKIIRWLLSHTFLILLIVAVIYGYMFWGNLTGEDTPAGKALAYLSNEYEEVGEFVAAVKAKQEKLSQQESSGIESSAVPQSSPENDLPVVPDSVDSNTAKQTPPAETQAAEQNNFTAPVTETSSTDSAVINNKSETQSENKGIEQPPVSNDSRIDTATMQNLAATSAAVESADDVAESGFQGDSTVSNVALTSSDVTEEVFVSTEIENQLDNVDNNGKLIDDSKQDDTIRASWITARKSFYQRKYDESEQNYQNVIDNTEDNFDAYGELGNVYFNQGKKEQAASAYFEAAAILVRQGQVDRARSLMGLLRNLDKSKANELKKLIDSIVS